MPGYLKTKRPYLILLVLYSANFIYNYIWIVQDKKPPGWDDAAHLMLSLSYYNILINPGWDLIGKIIQVSSYYPPFYHSFIAFMYLLFGKSLTIALMTNSLFFGVLLISTYGIGKKLFNEETGLLAAILISFYPSIFQLERVLLLEIPLVALVTSSVYFLILTEKFGNYKYSIAAGITAALSVLTKWTAVFFIAGPLLCIVHDAVSSKTIDRRVSEFLARSRTKKQSNGKLCDNCGKTIASSSVKFQNKNFCSNICKKMWKNKSKVKTSHTRQGVNIILFVLSAVLISSIWYIPHIEDVYYNVILGQTSMGAAEGDPPFLSIKGIFYYTYQIFNFQTSVLFFIPFAIGGIFLIRSKENYQRMLLFSWIFVPYLVFTIFSNKDPRYTLPIIASVAIISALWINQLKTRESKVALVSVIILFGSLQLYSMVYVTSLSQATTIDMGYYDLFMLIPGNAGGARPVWTENWKTQETLETITIDAQHNPRTQGRYAIVLVLPDYHIINGYTFQYYAMNENLPLNFYNAAYLPSPYVFYTNFKNIDYVIVKSGDDTAGARLKPMVDEMYKFFEENRNGTYQLIKNHELPDNTTLSIYRNVYSG